MLHYTGRLRNDFQRRIMETGQFLVDVLQPGGLEDGAVGLRSIQRVRLMHATIRALIEQDAPQHPGLWQPEWGTPINQEDLAGTLQSFAYVVDEPLPRLGIRVGREDADAYVYLWNVIGTQLGVDPDLQPCDIRQSRQLVAQIRRRQYAASAEGAEMADALVTFLQRSTPGHLGDPYVATLVRYLVGDDVGDMIAIPAGAKVPSLLRRLLALLTFNREGLVGGRSWIQHVSVPLSRELISTVFATARFGTRIPWKLPDELREAWNIP